jgi:DNA-binding response OmpR family regulator
VAEKGNDVGFNQSPRDYSQVDEDIATRHDTATARNTGSHRRASHILFVSDAPQDLDAAADFLRNQLFRVSFASGWHAYHHAQAWHPEMILIDGSMRDMDAFMMARLLRQSPDTNDIPLIFISAPGQAGMGLEAFSLGAVDCISKPLYPEELLARISVHLRAASEQGSRQADTDPRLPRAVRAQDLLLRNALSAIQQDVGSIHTVRQLAHAIGTNERKLSTVFKSKMGKSAYKVIFEKKMDTARRLLAHTSMPVNDIAHHVGFPSVCNFTVAFRRNEGITPTGFRRQAKETAISNELDEAAAD